MPHAEMTVVLGKRGSGKSCLARHLVRDAGRLLVWDPLREHQALGLVTSGPQELYDHCQAFDLFRAVADWQPTQDGLPEFAWFLEYARALGEERGGVTLLVDEVDMFASPRSVPAELDWLCRYGRHVNVSLVAVSRRPAEMPRILTSQAAHLYVSNMSEPADVQFVRAATGGCMRFTEVEAYEFAHYRL